MLINEPEKGLHHLTSSGTHPASFTDIASVIFLDSSIGRASGC